MATPLEAIPSPVSLGLPQLPPYPGCLFSSLPESLVTGLLHRLLGDQGLPTSLTAASLSSIWLAPGPKPVVVTGEWRQTHTELLPATGQLLTKSTFLLPRPNPAHMDSWGRWSTQGEQH